MNKLTFKDCTKKPYYKITSIILSQKGKFSYKEIKKQVIDKGIEYRNVNGYSNLIKHALRKLNNVCLIYQVGSLYMTSTEIDKIPFGNQHK